MRYNLVRIECGEDEENGFFLLLLLNKRQVKFDNKPEGTKEITPRRKQPWEREKKHAVS